MSAGLSLAALGIGTQIPLTLLATPLWVLYGIGCGTIAMGCWVLAHECGHNAFHPNRRIEGTVGFLLHSTAGALLQLGAQPQRSPRPLQSP